MTKRVRWYLAIDVVFLVWAIKLVTEHRVDHAGAVFWLVCMYVNGVLTGREFNG